MSVYEAYINKIVPKVLTQVDRDIHSRTYGSCDRNFWHLKIRDFSSAILQQTGLALFLLYELDFGGNICFGKTDVREWAKGTLYFWKKIQLKDGSFNEYWPNEHGFPPTAFSLYTACELYKRLGLCDDSLVDAFEKTGKYLVGHIETQAYNQELASITALYSLYTITRKSWVLEGVNKKLKRILDLQSSEGWFPEYGGADIGYLSVSLDMLAEYYWMSRDESVIKPLNKMIDFLVYFIHPDGTVGGEYGSRNTIYFCPNGLEVLTQLGNEKAAAIKDAILGGAGKNYYFMDSVDDRYCSHYLLHSFLRALQKEMEYGIKKTQYALPYKENIEKYFEEAGIYIRSLGNVYLITGLRKGGVTKLYIDGKECFIDCGYRINYGAGKVAATNWQDSHYIVHVDSGTVQVEGQFSLVALKVPSPLLHMGLRVVAKVVGNKIINTLKKKIIFTDKHKEIAFCRKVCIEEGKLIIRDQISSPVPVRLECAGTESLRHVASGKFFSVSDLAPRCKERIEDVKDIHIKKEINLRTGAFRISKD